MSIKEPLEGLDLSVLTICHHCTSFHYLCMEIEEDPRSYDTEEAVV